LLRDTLGVKVALEAKFQTTVKAKQVSGGGNIGIEITKDVKELTSKTTATAKVRGGDVSMVSILTNGGAMDNGDETISAWQNSCSPALAVMVDMTLIPIYAIISDAYAREVLTNYFNTKLGT
jgi:hypothetical protein